MSLMFYFHSGGKLCFAQRQARGFLTLTAQAAVAYLPLRLNGPPAGSAPQKDPAIPQAPRDQSSRAVAVRRKRSDSGTGRLLLEAEPSGPGAANLINIVPQGRNGRRDGQDGRPANAVSAQVSAGTGRPAAGDCRPN